MKRLPLARFRVFAVFVGLTILVGMAASASTAGSQAASGTLNLNTALRLRSVIGECPSGVSASTCADRTSTGPFAGLGQVTGTYTFLLDTGPPVCADGLGKARAYPVRFSLRPRARSISSSPPGWNA